MTTSIKTRSDSFYGALAAIAMVGPMLLVIAASAMPESPETGEFIVFGHGMILAALAAALVLRAAYVRGFSKALKIMALRPNYSVTA